MIRSKKSKDKLHNSQNKDKLHNSQNKDKLHNSQNKEKMKEQTFICKTLHSKLRLNNRNHIKTGANSCTRKGSGTHCVTLVSSPTISKEWWKDFKYFLCLKLIGLTEQRVFFVCFKFRPTMFITGRHFHLLLSFVVYTKPHPDDRFKLVWLVRQ